MHALVLDTNHPTRSKKEDIMRIYFPDDFDAILYKLYFLSVVFHG